MGVDYVKMLFLLTPGGSRERLHRRRRRPEAGQKASLSGPERLETLVDLMVKYGIEALPEV